MWGYFDHLYGPKPALVKLLVFPIIIISKFKMTTVMNQKLSRSFLRSLEDRVLRKVKTYTKKVTNEELVQMIMDCLPAKASSRHARPEVQAIISSNHDTIADNLVEIGYLRRKAQLEDSLTASFVRALLKDRNKHQPEQPPLLASRNELGCSLIKLSRCENSRADTCLQSVLADEQQQDKSPIGSISRATEEESGRSPRYGVCATSRSRTVMSSRYQSSEFAQEMQPDEREKIKALQKLRKLEKYVFEKQNINRDMSKSKVWNYGVSPSKKRFQEENQNLKAIQTNLVTHLNLLEKFREIPSVEGLVAREEALKKKQRQLRELSENLQKKEFELNRKHTQFLKKQKSQKLL